MKLDRLVWKLYLPKLICTMPDISEPKLAGVVVFYRFRIILLESGTMISFTQIPGSVSVPLQELREAWQDLDNSEFMEK